MPSSVITDNGTQSRYWVPMLGSAIRILEVFFDAKAELSLHEVSTASKVGKTSTFRILYTLDKLGYVQRNSSTGRYRLGLRILTAAHNALWGDNLLFTARPLLEQLRDEVDETINLATLRNGRIIYLEIIESLHPFRMVATAGAIAPWHSTALGKVIAAHLPESRVREALKGYRMTRFTKNTITSRKEFLAALRDVRGNGYAVDNEETELGATCVAVPILDNNHQALGGISISGPTPRVKNKEKKIIRALRTVTVAIPIP
jgi:IclR family acetate operon transcriptional repressor